MADWLLLGNTLPKIEDSPAEDTLALVSLDVDSDLTVCFANPALLSFLATKSVQKDFSFLLGSLLGQ